MVIFSHRGIGFGEKENSLEAISKAVEQGFSVEVDLRLKNNHIILSHDSSVRIEDKSNFSNILKIARSNPKIFFALHLKENSADLFKKSADSIKEYRNCFLFVTDFDQDKFIINSSKIVKRENLALYVTSKGVNLDLAEKVGSFWLDETKDNIYGDLDHFISFNKRIICCSPELFLPEHNNERKRLKQIANQNDKIFGICSDFAREWLKAR